MFQGPTSRNIAILKSTGVFNRIMQKNLGPYSRQPQPRLREAALTIAQLQFIFVVAVATLILAILTFALELFWGSELPGQIVFPR